MNCPIATNRSQRDHRAAFTLIELLISIALVVVLILGVNKVFQYTTSAVGQGQVINSAIRDSRAAQSTFTTDFAAMVPNGTTNTSAPCIILNSFAVPAFRDRADEAGDKGVGSITTNPPYPRELTIDLDGNGTEGDPNVPGEVISPLTYNFRNHRTDVFSFFARDNFHRQTGNLGTIAADMSSQEAWIWYGHLWLPDNNGNYPVPAITGVPSTFPGEGGSASVNPNNYYASQFVLGRMAVLLVEKDATGVVYRNPPSTSDPQRFFDHSLAYPPPSPRTPLAADLEPLSVRDTSPAPLAGDNSTWLFQQSRFDLASTSMATFSNKLQSYLANGAALDKYWDLMMDGARAPTTAFPPGNGFGTRFQCNPFISKPMTSDKMAQVAPYFLQGCSQFIVEYAGDYLTQQNDPSKIGYGTLQAVGPDNQIDYVLINNGPAAAKQVPAKQIIWYGLPRSVMGRTDLKAGTGDVVPLRDWIPGQVPRPFEKKVLPYPAGFAGDYMRVPYSASFNNGVNVYTCAWDGTAAPPKLIRITITLTDSGGRLPDGITYQYIFAVPQS